ncbi:MAG: FAD-binding oxidoreductase [Candidatus Aminicenantales bacterium]
MAKLRGKKIKWLEEKFGDRVNFSPTERLLYSHDIASVPPMVKPLIGKTIPETVIRPQNETELVELAKWASAHKIPLVPRGKGSSGYGGVFLLGRE